MSTAILLTAFAGAPALGAAAFYVRGRRASGHPWRDPAFLTGLVILLLSSSWPLEHLARHHFDMHQVAFLGLRIAGPMLIALSHPAGALLRGMPRHARRNLAAPLFSNRAVRALWQIVRLPQSTLALYLCALFAWTVPAWQDTAILSPVGALILHSTLFLAGIIFWTRIFDPRPEPHGLRHPVRLMMLWLAILSQILVGSATTLKSALWYPAYATDHASIAATLRDEMIGGFFLWIPSSLVTLLGLLAVVDMWGRHETRMDLRRTSWSPSNSAILLYPTTGQALRDMARPRNRRLAIWMILFALFILSAAVSVGIAYGFA